MSKLLPHEKKFWRKLITHSEPFCRGNTCPVHNPSDHHMRGWPLHYRKDRELLERICKHGVGHPDPDDRNPDHTHGCDGCCNPTSGSNP